MIDIDEQIAAALNDSAPKVDVPVDAGLPQGYLDLPIAIRQYLSAKEWMWLGDAEKARLIQDETEPDYET